MRKTLIVAAAAYALLVAGCGSEERGEPDSSRAPEAPVSTPNEKTYDLVGAIVGRNAEAKTLTIEHQAIGDWMDAMTMTFPVRGGEFAALPADGVPIHAMVHVAENGDYWVTDVVESPEALEAEPAEGEAPESGDSKGKEISL